MTCDFTSFPTVFQSYQDGGRVIMKDSVQWNPVYVQKRSLLQAQLEPTSPTYLIIHFSVEQKNQ